MEVKLQRDPSIFLKNAMFKWNKTNVKKAKSTIAVQKSTVCTYVII